MISADIVVFSLMLGLLMTYFWLVPLKNIWISLYNSHKGSLLQCRNVFLLWFESKWVICPCWLQTLWCATFLHIFLQYIYVTYVCVYELCKTATRNPVKLSIACHLISVWLHCSVHECVALKPHAYIFSLCLPLSPYSPTVFYSLSYLGEFL